MGGTPPPPLYGQNFKQKGSYGFGGYSPPFTDKIRKVVFDLLPNGEAEYARTCLGSLHTAPT